MPSQQGQQDQQDQQGQQGQQDKQGKRGKKGQKGAKRGKKDKKGKQGRKGKKRKKGKKGQWDKWGQMEPTRSRMKKPPSKVALNSQLIFSLSTSLAAQTAQKQKSRTITKSPLMQNWVRLDWGLLLQFEIKTYLKCMMPV